MVNKESIIKIMEDENIDTLYINNCSALAGLMLLQKYLPDSGISAAEHDIIYSSCSLEELVEAGITREDVEKLNELGWMVEEGEYFAKFV